MIPPSLRRRVVLCGPGFEVTDLTSIASRVLAALVFTRLHRGSVHSRLYSIALRDSLPRRLAYLYHPLRSRPRCYAPIATRSRKLRGNPLGVYVLVRHRERVILLLTRYIASNPSRSAMLPRAANPDAVTIIPSTLILFKPSPPHLRG